MCDRNPGEIDFGSSYREIRVSEGSSYRESTVYMMPPGGVLPYRRLMWMCRWMGSHFHDWTDYNGVAHFLIFGVRQFSIFTVSKRTRVFVL